MMNQTTLLDLILIQLIQYSQDLVDHNSASNSASIAKILDSVSPLFSQLYSLNRQHFQLVKSLKSETNQSKLVIDTNDLHLSNLRYQRNHLVNQITACQQFQSQHSTLPLHTLEEYQQLCHASQDDDKEEMEQAQDAHAVMLKRLQFELDERIRLDGVKKELGLKKAILQKENQVKKARLEELEKQLDDFLTSARAIQLIQAKPF